MHTPKNKISELIVNHLKGQLDEEQQKELNEWLEKPEHQGFFNRIVTKETILNKSLQYDAFNQKAVWEKINNQISRKTDYRKWLSYAAVILLPLAIGFFIITHIPQYETEIVQLQEVKPGETNAKLYFSNGEVVDLKKDTSKILRSEDNLLVRREKEQLRINSDQLASSDAMKMNRIVTPIGGEYQIELPDGTKVWLNADSYLEFPSKFSKKQRKVVVKGEVYFDVSSNKKWPFIVKSGSMELKVLGTEFNIRNYKDEDEIITSLIEGSVEVSNGSKERIQLIPGREVLIATSDNSMQERAADIGAVTAWRKGRFIFKKKKVEDIMYDLARWYNVKIFFSNSSVKDVTMTLDVARYGNIKDVLSLMEGTREVNFNISGNIINVN